MGLPYFLVVFTLDGCIYGKHSLKLTLLDSEDRIKERQSTVFPEVVTIFAITDINEIMVFKFYVIEIIKFPASLKG